MKHKTTQNELLTMTTKDLIEFCQDPPRDVEFNELKAAADILAGRYAECLKSMNRF